MAIFVDATLIRMVLVPSIMELLGDVNWWMPTWLGRLLPKGRAQPTEGRVGSLQPAPVGTDGYGQASGDGHVATPEPEHAPERGQ